MSEPRRWLQDRDAPPELQDLVRGVQRPAPLTPLKRGQIAARLGEAYAPAAATLPFWLKASMAVGVVLASAAALVIFDASRPAPAPAPASRAAATVPGVPPANPPPPAGDPAAAPQLPAELPRPAPELPGPVAVPARPTPADTLAREAALLEQARRAASRDPALALTLLQRHRTQFPRGELTPERLYLSWDVLRRMGNEKAAARQAAALLDRYPKSTYAARLSSRRAE